MTTGASISRRTFLRATIGAAGLGAIGAGCAIARIHDTTSEIELVELNVPIAGLPKSFNGYRIGFLTDLHLGPCVPIEWAERAVRLLVESKIDLLALGGDNIWIPESRTSRQFGYLRGEWLGRTAPQDLPMYIYSSLAQLLSQHAPKDGCYGVFGNHDLWVSPRTCLNEFGSQGITTLVNTSVQIRRGSETIELVGVDDFWNGLPSLPAPMVSGNRGDGVRVLLSHNPDFVSSLLESTPLGALKASSGHPPQISLALCGHTHGGQIKLPGIGPLHYNVQDARLGEGLYVDSSGMQIYTSRGIGVVELPYRINCPGEATLVTLEQA